MLAEALLIIASLLAIAFIALLGIQRKNNAGISQIWNGLQTVTPSTERFSKEMISNQPEPVQRYFLHTIAEGTAIANSAQITMKGTIRLAPTQDWMFLEAEELLSPQGFVWKARARQGVMQMQGADYYTTGAGRMRFSLWGLIPLVNAQNPDLTRSAIGRAIGERFWLPSALLPQRGVKWSAIDANTIQANLELDHEPITLTFVIDSQGKLLKSSFLRWGDQTEDKHYAKIPFGAKYQAERTFCGYTIPSQLSAGWWIDTDRYFEFFRVSIENVEFQ